jgi:hypothetical protein
MRIVALSDQHGFLPDIPPCDLLIVAGDQCPDGFGGRFAREDGGKQQAEWFMDVWGAWRRAQPAKFCVGGFGNHDYCGERLTLPSNGGPRLSFDHGETVFLVDEGIEIAGLKIWCTPWSSQFRDWAFMQSEDALAELYKKIPAGLDILVSHQPVFGKCDVDDSGNRLGSKALLQAVQEKAPRALVCGHIHGGHGRASLLANNDHVVAIYNVAVMNERYHPQWEPTAIILPPREE